MTRCWAVLLLCAWLSACATGREPPRVTATASVQTGLAFQFGFGDQACGVTLSEHCTDTSQAFELGTPAVLVELKPFAIDTHEVTNTQYRHCVETGPCSLPAKRSSSGIESYYGTVDGDRIAGVARYGNYPVVHVHWQQASEYCAWVGKRLPSEAEYERVASGPGKKASTKRVYPWGKAGPVSELGDCKDRDVNLYACLKDNRPGPVKGFGDDKVLEDGSPIWDLFGNVAEWTGSDADPLVTCDQAATFDCAACNTCVASTRNRLACNIECNGCTCGAASPAKSNVLCYAPCAAPVCVQHDPSKQPIAMPAGAKNTMAHRVIRGGSFAVGSGVSIQRPCEGRADHRLLNRRQDFSDAATGFRCAKSL